MGDGAHDCQAPVRSPPRVTRVFSRTPTCGVTANKHRDVSWMLKFGRIAVVSTAALTIVAATLPTSADAADLPLPARVAYSAPRPRPAARFMLRRLRPAAKSMLHRLRHRAAAIMAAMLPVMAALTAAAIMTEVITPISSPIDTRSDHSRLTPARSRRRCPQVAASRAMTSLRS
jgi:hypothetical protein